MSRVSSSDRATAGAAEVFGRYRLHHELASGGMGSVYLARTSGPAGFEKLVALKRIHAHLAKDPRFVDMFLDEARIAARIQHPNVCSVIDFGEIEDAFYLTMPYIQGEPLHRVIAAAAKRDDAVGDRLPLMAMRLVADACEGLHAAHELRDDEGQPLDVVHRDVSPHNLMVGYDGIVRVLDFGVASARHRQYQTSTGEVKGKFAYASPEQIEASKDIDRRSDVWSLGVVLWETLTGRRLFARENLLATVRAVADMPIPPVESLLPEVRPGLQPILDRALARDAALRYATAREMGRELQQLLAVQADFVTSGEVGDWMNQLFPRGIQHHERLADMTRTGPIPLTDPGVDSSGVQCADASSAAPAAAAEGPASPAVEAAATRRRGGALPVLLGSLVGMIALVAMGGGVLAATWFTGRAPEVPETSADVSSGEPSAPAGDTLAQVPPEAVPAREPTEPEATEPEATEPEAAGVEASAPGDEPDVPSEPSGSADSVADSARPDTTEAAGATQRTARRLAPGTLTVATPGGWALVFHDGRSLGETPGVFRLPGGRQVIQVQPFGRGPRQRRTVRVPPGGTVRLSIPLRL